MLYFGLCSFIYGVLAYKTTYIHVDKLWSMFPSIIKVSVHNNHSVYSSNRPYVYSRRPCIYCRDVKTKDLVLYLGLDCCIMTSSVNSDGKSVFQFAVIVMNTWSMELVGTAYILCQYIHIIQLQVEGINQITYITHKLTHPCLIRYKGEQKLLATYDNHGTNCML